MKSDVSVQSTNDCSTLSKVSAASMGYFTDNFQKCFVNRKCRRSPLIHRGYCVRYQAISFCLREFIKDTQGYGQRQVVSLGCGFDSLFFRLRTQLEFPKDVCVWEVDFPSVVKRKCLLIEQTEALQSQLGTYEIPSDGGPVVLSAEDYKLLGVDLSDLSALDAAFGLAGVRWKCPTLILSEVVMCYMEPARSTAVIGWAAQRFHNIRFVSYEQSFPSDPFGQVMMNHFSSLNSALLSLTTYPTMQDQEQRFLQNGWTRCRVMDMNQFYLSCVTATETRRIDLLEPFDEFEEFHLKCCHYFILVASQGFLAEIPTLCSIPDKRAEFHTRPIPVAKGTLRVVPLPGLICGLRRFGHRSCYSLYHCIISTGGFGEKDGKHQRLMNTHLLLHGSDDWDKELTMDSWDGRLLHSMTPVLEGRKILVLGGRFSPSRPANGALILTHQQGANCVTVTHRELQPDILRWRHTANEVILSGRSYVFVFGGRSVSSMVLQDPVFLCPETLSLVQVEVVGCGPSSRHSHSSCGWKDGTIISGGLLQSGIPSGSIILLRPCTSYFKWERLETVPSLTPRYSHSSHVIGDKLLLVGGVWIHCQSVPGVTIIDLTSGHCSEYQLDTLPLEWPLMLHGHSSVVLPDEKHLMLLGGGGNCFSFGTHLNSQPVIVKLPSDAL